MSSCPSANDWWSDLTLILARARRFSLRGRAWGGGGVDATLHRVSKLNAVKFSRKNRRIALDEYSRLVVRFLVLGQYLTQL